MSTANVRATTDISSTGSAAASATGDDPRFYYSIHGDHSAGQQVEFDATGDAFTVELSPVLGTLTQLACSIWIMNGDDASSANFVAKLRDKNGTQVSTTQTIRNGVISSAGASYTFTFSSFSLTTALQPARLEINAVALADGFIFPTVSDLLATGTYTPTSSGGGVSRARAVAGT